MPVTSLVFKIQRAFGVGNGAAGDHQNFPCGVGHDLLVGAPTTSAGCSIRRWSARRHNTVLRQGVRQDQIKRLYVDQRLVTHDLQIQVGFYLGGNSQMRPVGVSWSGLVMQYSTCRRVRHASAMRSSSVAINTSSSFCTFWVSWHTHQIMGLPKISASGLPGIRVLA